MGSATLKSNLLLPSYYPDQLLKIATKYPPAIQRLHHHQQHQRMGSWNDDEDKHRVQLKENNFLSTSSSRNQTTFMEAGGVGGRIKDCIYQVSPNNLSFELSITQVTPLENSRVYKS